MLVQLVPTLGQSMHSKYQDQETRATAYTDSTPTYLQQKTVLSHFKYGTTDNGYRFNTYTIQFML
jgi:hypothetical protein